MLILAAVLAIFLYGMIAATLGTILPDLSAKLGLTPRESGTVAFAQAVGLMVSSLLVGPLLDHEGHKVGLVLGLGLAAVALFALPGSRRFSAIVACLFILGLGGGIIVTGANSLASTVGEARRAATLNLVNLFFGLGGLLAPFLSANLLGKNLTRLCNLIGSLAVITLAIHLATPMPAPAGAQGFVLAETVAVFNRPILFLLAFFLFLYVACEVGIWNWLPQHLIAQGIPQSKALNILSLGFAVGLLVGRVAVLPILIKLSSLQVLLGCSLSMAATTFLMLRTSRAGPAGILVFLGGVAMAPVFPTTLAVVGDIFPRMSSTALGIVVACGWLGLAVSSRIIGSVAGGDPRRLRRALLIIPASSLIMSVVDLGIQSIAGS